MALEDTNKVDGIAYSDERRTLTMLLTDAWSWDDELWHLTLLQDKLNAYASFVNGGQWSRAFPGANPSSFVFDIKFMHPITENCAKLLSSLADMYNDKGLGIKFEVSTGEE
jgi:hypothetical protein